MKGMADCGSVNLADLPYPFQRVLTKFLDYNLFNGLEFSVEDFDMDLDYDPEVRAKWASPRLGSLNNNSNEFHEAISEVVAAKTDIVIHNLREWVAGEGMDNVYVDSALRFFFNSVEEFDPNVFSTELWNESHRSDKGFEDSGIVHFITKGYIGINMIYEPYSPILEHDDDLIVGGGGEVEQEVQERTYYIPMRLIGTIRGDYGLNKKGNWEGYIDAREFALTQIDDGIVNMRHLSAIVECIQ